MIHYYKTIWDGKTQIVPSPFEEKRFKGLIASCEGPEIVYVGISSQEELKKENGNDLICTTRTNES